MPSVTTQGVVLRYSNYRENDRMLTLLSPSLGKLDVMSRGCRKLSSPLHSVSEMFITGEFVLYQNKDKYQLVSAEAAQNFYDLRLDVDRLTAAVYLCDLCREAAQTAQPQQTLYYLLLRSLAYMDYSAESLTAIVSAFLLSYASALGYTPRMNHCAVCMKKLPEGSARFDISAGGVVCREHSESAENITAGEEEWIRAVIKGGIDEFLRLPVKDAPLGLLRRYVETRLDRPIKSGAMLK
ncbi:MAG: DNA repair protein RecO [Eubacteriales bacterium]|nr:DNA repair protein RecO [Eubacteriales bacterium]MDD3881222.1 DNA repair protein RecO [Eubacteriales bacterium]MDD4512140.1 DNA repair protein RecO [Eubacteriales bacterium]